MTDNEIIKALRAVAKKYEGKPVATFETNISNMATDAADRIERLCDEINRQKAEIEELQGTLKFVRGTVARLLETSDEQQAKIEKLKEAYAVYEETTGLKQVRSEAIREFAERLKLYLFIERGGISTVSGKDIDNLVKEMTEGQI